MIFGPAPEYDETLPRVLATATPKGQVLDQAAADHQMPKPKQTDDLFASTRMPTGVKYVSVYSTICQSSCRLFVGEVTIQFDHGHLTAEGSEFLARNITLV